MKKILLCFAVLAVLAILGTGLPRSTIIITRGTSILAVVANISPSRVVQPQSGLFNNDIYRRQL